MQGTLPFLVVSHAIAVMDGGVRDPLSPDRTADAGGANPNHQRSNRSCRRLEISRSNYGLYTDESAEVRRIMHGVYHTAGWTGETGCMQSGNADRNDGGACYGSTSRHVPRRTLKRLKVHTGRVVMARSKCSVGAFWLQHGWPSQTGRLVPEIRRATTDP